MKKSTYLLGVLLLSLFIIPEGIHTNQTEDLAVIKGCESKTLPDGTVIKRGMSCTGPLIIRPNY